MAVADGADDARRPDRRAVFAQGGHVGPAGEVEEGGAGAEAASKEFGLTLGHRALDIGRCRNGATGEVVGGKLRRIEVAGAYRYARQGFGEGPGGIEGAAAGGVVRSHGGILPGAGGIGQRRRRLQMFANSKHL
ncbi:hypothetical protein D9M68_766800 [compost metagenome]